MTRRTLTRLVAASTLALGAAVLALVLLGGSGSYRVDAMFADAGQLLPGDLVEVAGRPVGKITAIRLTDHDTAAVRLDITDDAVAPLHQGTVATIRAVGLSAIANRFVELSPGPPDQPRIPDGGTLDATHTRGIVDLDTLLDAMTPSVRRHVQSILREAATVGRGAAAGQANDALAALDPALSQTAALGREVVLDQAALTSLVRTGATVSTTLARGQADLGAGVDHAARVLRALAGRRAAVGDILARTPATARHTQRTLAAVDGLLPHVDAVLRDARPAVPLLASLLRRTVPLARNATPAIASIRALLPQSRAALRPLPALDRAASPALASTATALKDLLPIVTGLRAYAPDVIAGFFDGFGGSTGGYYDANGHFLRISLQGSSASLPGLVPAMPETGLPVVGGYRTGLDARCPGGAEEPVADGSNPWRPAGLESLCDPKHDHR